MSKKNKKQKIKQKPAPTTPAQSSLSFSLSKWFKKTVATHPSALIITVIFIGFALFLLGGGIFTATTKGILPSYYDGNKFYFLFPSISEQFIADTVISVMLYIIGFAGLLTIVQSARSANKPRQAYMLMAVGISLILLSYICLESAINIKMQGF
jgi:hypothetical protein